MLAMVLCNVQKIECMFHWRDNCLTYAALREYVELKFEECVTEEHIT